MKKLVFLIVCTICSFQIAFAQSTDTNKTTYRQYNSHHDDGNWETYFMPGAVLHTYIPDISDSIGVFTGVSVEYLIAAWIHNNDNRGPSHGRIYTKVNFMKSSKSGISDIFYWGLGLDLSIERKPDREYLIPYFGLEIGSMYQKGFGSVFEITPTLGVHLYSSQNLFVNLSGGYIYPADYLEELRGYTVQLGVDLSLW